MPETQAPASQMFRVEIKAPPEAVWQEITRTDAPIKAFFNTRMDAGALAPGATIAMRTPDGKYTGVVGKILDYDPPRRFAHTFRFTNYDDPECVVVYELRPTDAGTEFTLTIENLAEGTKTAKQMIQGGKMIVDTLKAVMETGKPPLGTRALFVLFKVMQPMTPAKCRSEHWPVSPAEGARS